MDVTMPDGTVIEGVPDGTTKAQLTKKYQAHLGKTAGPPEQKSPDFTLGRWAGLEGRNLIAGAAALPATLLDIPAQAYNTGADLIQGKGKGFRYNEMNQNVSAMLDKAGLPQPETTGEQVGSTIARTVAGAGTGLGIGQGMQGAATPVVAGVGKTMAANPGKQMASALLSGGTVAGAQKAGLPWWAQAGAGLVTGTLPYLSPSSLASGGKLAPEEQRAMAVGYKLPPATMDNPSLLSKLLGGWSGKIKSQQAASVANQEVTNAKAAAELGLAPDATLDDHVLEQVRKQAGTAYETVKKAIPNIAGDNDYLNDLVSIQTQNHNIAQYFPDLVKNDDITKLVDSLANQPHFPTEVGVDTVKVLRKNAATNLRTDDPQKVWLGQAQRNAATAIENLMDRNISATGNPDAISAYRAARTTIAKSYDIEAATNPATGDVSAAKIASLSNRGRPMTDGLASVADTANAFPKATQSPSRFGGVEPFSVLDLGAAAYEGTKGKYGVAGAILGRPLARALTMSDAYQGAVQNPSSVLGPGAGAQGIPLNAALVRGLKKHGSKK